SRGRHTRSTRDWSSDVCSSDLLIGGGVVLTGGTSLLPGAAELAEQVFEMPVRLGLPRGLGGLSANVCDPRYATGVGLVLHAAREIGRASWRGGGSRRGGARGTW